MGDTGQPPGHINPQPPQPSAQKTMTPVMKGDGTPGRMCSFDEIIYDEKRRRNILTVSSCRLLK